MAEMTSRERILTATNRQRADKIPFFSTWRYLPIGQAERECRNRGMGITWERPSCTMKLHGVTVVEETDRSNPLVVRRTYKTPVGSISLLENRTPGCNFSRGMRGWDGGLPWQRDRAIHTPDDYKVLKYIFENTEYIADYYPLEQAKEWLGEDGVVVDYMRGLGPDFSIHSAMQTLLIDWIGGEGGRCFVHLAKYPDLMDDLYRTISKSHEAMYEIAAKSPAEVVWFPDNIDSVLVNPKIFEKYFLPEYKKFTDACHAGGKFTAVHIDGRMNDIKHLIAQTDLDIIEAFCPPPMGDLTASEALTLWPDKVLWMGFPGTVYTMGDQAIKEFTVDLLEDCMRATGGERVCLTTSTENLVKDEHMLLLASIMEKVELPLTEEKIAKIRAELGLPQKR